MSYNKGLTKNNEELHIYAQSVQIQYAIWMEENWKLVSLPVDYKMRV